MNNPSDAPSPAPRRGPPSGSSTLSERIAALQRKASGSSGAAGGAAGGSSSSSGVGGSASSSSGSRIGLGAPPAAVRDRIARFQPRGASADAASAEKPLVPRSSFGAPAPAPGTGQGSLRPYPGAAPAGSAGWGEGVLRPQLTGGNWGHQELRPNLTGLRPQMTGGAWGRSPSYSDSPRSTLGARDAFLELDDEASHTPGGGSLGRNTARLIGRSHSPASASAAAAAALSTSPAAGGAGAPAGRISPSAARPVSMRRGSSFSAAQLDAASAGLRRSESLRRSGEIERSDSPSPAPRAVGAAAQAHGANGNAREAALPDVPRAEPGENNGLPSLPSAPKGQPRSPLPLAPAEEMGDTSVEIEVRNVDHATVQRMQERLASASPMSSPAKTQNAAAPGGDAASATETADADGQDGASAIGRLALGDDSSPPALTPQRAALNRALSQRSAQSVESAHSGVAYRDSSPSPLPPSSSSPAPAAAAASVTPSTPTATSSARSTSRTTPASSAPTSVASAVLGSHQRGHRSQPSNESGIIDPLRDAADEAAASAASPLARTNGSSATPADADAATRTAAAAAPPQVQPPSPAAAAAAQRARDAISLARAKSASQKLRRPPPPGMTLSVAEMDMSDDEYEPGWASVISTSRTSAM